MQLLITRQTVAQRTTVRPGQVVDVSASEARVLRGARKAIPVDQAQQQAGSAKGGGVASPSTSKRNRKAKS